MFGGVFDGRRLPRPLTALRVIESGDIDAALAGRAAGGCRRRRGPRHGADPVAAGRAARRRGGLRAAAANRRHPGLPVPAGRRAARRARRGSAQRVPLIRDETGSAIVGQARWQPTVDARGCTGRPSSTTPCSLTATSTGFGSSRPRRCPAFAPA